VPKAPFSGFLFKVKLNQIEFEDVSHLLFNYFQLKWTACKPFILLILSALKLKKYKLHK